MSLFEDNAEHGLGMFLGQKTLRNRVIAQVKALAEKEEKYAKLQKLMEKESWLKNS